MKKLLLSLLLIYLHYNSNLSGQIVINEVNQASGNSEWVELIVTASGCNTTADLRLMIFDDNNGRFITGSGNGLAQGAARFASVANWAAVPAGSMIVMYASPKAANLPADDPTDNNCDGVYVLPYNSPTLIEQNSGGPAGATAGPFSSPAFNYPTTGWAPAGAGIDGFLGMSNTTDSWQIYAAGSNGVSTPPLSAVSWGSNANTPNAIISLTTSSQHTINEPMTSGDWAAVAANAGTPGFPNTCANHKYINDFRRVAQKSGTTATEQNTELACVVGTCEAFKLNTLALSSHPLFPNTTICSGESIKFAQALVTQEPQFCAGGAANQWDYIITEDWTTTPPVASGGGISTAAPTQTAFLNPCSSGQNDAREWQTPALNNTSCATHTIKYTRTVKSTLTNGLSTITINDPNASCAVLTKDITITVKSDPQAPTTTTTGCTVTIASCGAAQNVSVSTFTTAPGSPASTITVGVSSGAGGNPMKTCEKMFTVATPACPALPIALVRFEAELKDNKVNLNWETASEINSDYMDIEKSLNGHDFFKIGQVKAAGTSNSTLYYAFKDENLSKGSNYYRLKQVDQDGKSEVSQIRMVQFGKVLHEVSISPNPVSNMLNLTFNEAIESDLEASINDMYGRLVKTVHLNEGTLNYTVETDDLLTGFYCLTLKTRENQQVLRFVKN